MYKEKKSKAFQDRVSMYIVHVPNVEQYLYTYVY